MVNDKETPPEIPGLEASEAIEEPFVNRVDLSGIQQDSVRSVGVDASAIPPTPRERAGLELSKIVLLLTGLSIAGLVTFLFVEDTIGKYSLREAYQHVYMQVENGGEITSTTGIASISASFRDNPDKELSSEDVSNLKNFIQSGLKSKTISDRQNNQLTACIGNKDTASRQNCADLIDVANKASGSAAVSSEKIRALTEFAKTVDEHQRSFQSFWLQAAQLILLNLLLPLLTGLFGYIFGTTQPINQQKPSSGS